MRFNAIASYGCAPLYLCYLLFNLGVDTAQAGRLNNAGIKPIVETEATGNNVENILNIHIVPHTHDDVGWLKTVDQYFNGQNNTIRHACVRCIIDSVIAALLRDPEKKFTYVEMAFFSMWWNDQTESMKESVRELVRNGQLAFVNGGWCMHDEATTHYMGMIDQTTLGHEFLKREFDYTPKVGWQLDPFGHSSTQASLLSSKAGFNALYFGRIDYQDLEQRHVGRECEGIWKASDNLEQASVFWGLTGSYLGNYGAPDGFCFDVLCDDDPLIGLEDEMLKGRVMDFLSQVRIQVDRTKGRNVMLTMGSDFQFEDAMENFNNLDLLIKTINDAQLNFTSMFPDFDGIQAFYSNPEVYTEYKFDEYVKNSNSNKASTDESYNQQSLSVKTDDFFPYSDCDHCFWTGYFTSRSGLKRLERVGSSFLHAARQIVTFFGDSKKKLSEPESALFELEAAMGVAQHHDGVSGTSKQHVADDYAMKIQKGIDGAVEIVRDILQSVLVKESGDGQISLADLAYCQKRNESICEITQSSTAESENKDVYVIVYNALGWTRQEVLSLPVSRASSLVEKMGDTEEGAVIWEEIDSIAIPNANDPNIEGAAPFNLFFDTGPLPPVGMSVYRVRKDVSNNSLKLGNHLNPVKTQRSLRSNKDFSVENNSIKVDFQKGVISKISILDEILDVTIDQEWGYYTSFKADSGLEYEEKVHDRPNDKNSGEKTQQSGAYIFRPSTPNEQLTILKPDPQKVTLTSTDLVTEIHTEFEVPWIKQVTRIVKGQPYIDVDYTVGPVPIMDGIGKEVVTRYKSNIQSNGSFYTDSNGREFIPRNRSQRESFSFEEFQPVAGNYYPVNAAIYLEDDDLSMSILTDRSQGGASLRDGNIELMVQRRIVYDDNRGVGEPMNETDHGISAYPPYGDASRLGDGVIIKGTHRILLGAGMSGAKLARSQMDAMFSPLQVFASSEPSDLDDSSNSLSLKHSALSAFDHSLPRSIQLITSKVLSSRVDNNEMTILLRLGHAYAYGESDLLAFSTALDLLTMFTDFEVLSVVEKTLTGNQNITTWETNRMIWMNDKDEEDVLHNHESSQSSGNDLGFIVNLSPMDIRTFEVGVRKKDDTL